MRAKRQRVRVPREKQSSSPLRGIKCKRERKGEAMAMIKSWGQEALMTEAWSYSSVCGCGSGCGSGGSTHSVFNEPFAALALNLLIELEPAAGCRM